MMGYKKNEREAAGRNKKILFFVLAVFFLTAGCADKTSDTILSETEILEYGSDILSLADQADQDVSYVILNAEGKEVDEAALKINTEYTVLFTAACENTQIGQWERKILFKDTEAPALVCKSRIVLEYTKETEINYAEFCTVKDNYDKEIELEYIEEGRDRIDKIGSYFLTVRSMDSSGNEAMISDIPVSIVDVIAPVIIGTKEVHVINAGENVDFSSWIKAYDDVDEEVAVTFNFENQRIQEPGKHTVLAVAIDSSGNRAEAEFTFRVAEPINISDSGEKAKEVGNDTVQADEDRNDLPLPPSEENQNPDLPDHLGKEDNDTTDNIFEAVCPGAFDESKPCDWAVDEGKAEEYPNGNYAAIFKGDSDLKACQAWGEEKLANGEYLQYICIGIERNDLNSVGWGSAAIIPK